MKRYMNKEDNKTTWRVFEEKKTTTARCLS